MRNGRFSGSCITKVDSIGWLARDGLPNMTSDGVQPIAEVTRVSESVETALYDALYEKTANFGLTREQFATYFTHGVHNGSKLRVEIYKATEAAQILDQVDAFFERELQAIPA